MFDFPNNPEDGDMVVHPNGKTYEFSSGSWSVVRSHDHDHDQIAGFSARLQAVEQLQFLLLE